MLKCDYSFFQLSVDSAGGIVPIFFMNHILYYHIFSEEDAKFFS
jgi:hypothetical protein